MECILSHHDSRRTAVLGNVNKHNCYIFDKRTHINTKTRVLNLDPNCEFSNRD